MLLLIIFIFITLIYSITLCAGPKKMERYPETTKKLDEQQRDIKQVDQQIQKTNINQINSPTNNTIPMKTQSDMKNTTTTTTTTSTVNTQKSIEIKKDGSKENTHHPNGSKENIHSNNNGVGTGGKGSKERIQRKGSRENVKGSKERLSKEKGKSSYEVSDSALYIVLLCCIT